MYKIGVMMMGRQQSNLHKVKEIVLEVQSKTKVKNVFEYLIELDKIKNYNVYISLQKKGRAISDQSTISQILKHTRPENGVIKLYLYEGEEGSRERLDLKKSRHEISSSSRINPEKNKSGIRESSAEESGGGFCCC